MGKGKGGRVEFDVTRLEGVEGMILAQSDLRGLTRDVDDMGSRVD